MLQNTVSKIKTTNLGKHSEHKCDNNGVNVFIIHVGWVKQYDGTNIPPMRMKRGTPHQQLLISISIRKNIMDIFFLPDLNHFSPFIDAVPHLIHLQNAPSEFHVVLWTCQPDNLCPYN